MSAELTPAEKNKLKKIEKELFHDYFNYKKPPTEIETLRKELTDFKISILKSVFDLYEELETLKSLVNSKLKWNPIVFQLSVNIVVCYL